MKWFRHVAGVIGPLLLVAIAPSCSHGPSAPTVDTTTASTGTPAVTETFSSRLAVGGSRFYSFSQASTGTVTATLIEIAGEGVPSTVVVNLGVGEPGGTTCNATTTAAVQVGGDAGLTNQLSGSQTPGVHCVIVTDVGNLFAAASFTVTIEHP